MKTSIPNERDDFLEKQPHKICVVAVHVSQIDREKCKILVERPQAYPGVLVDIPFSDFQEASIRAQYGEAFRNCLSGQGI
jgi:hypothetical protein